MNVDAEIPKNGNHIEYSEDGSKHAEGVYKHGRKHGVWGKVV